MSNKRTPIGRFIHNKWTGMKTRCGYYKPTKSKCITYSNIKIEFTREEFKMWCLERQDIILSLKRPSLDRIDSKKNYKLDNIQVIELTENIAKEKLISKNGKCVCYKCKETKDLTLFAVDKRRLTTGRTTICKSCDNKRKKKS